MSVQPYFYTEAPNYITGVNNPSLFEAAYLRWSKTATVCDCGPNEHGSALIENYVEASCDRHKSWQIYVKTRENIILTDAEKAFVGLM